MLTERMKLDFVRAFRAVSEEVHLVAVEKGWWDAPRNDGEMLALIHSEISEALEGLRHGDPVDEHIGGPGFAGKLRRGETPFRTAETELADAIIRIMDLVPARGWRIAEALVAKMAFNEGRPRRHGGKKF